MELRHLRYFVAVAEEENVSRAALRLHVSQPALSRQIRDLEDEIGFVLFERSAKSIRLTEAGRTFLGEARDVLARAQRAVDAAHAVATGRRGELQLGYAPTPTVRLLPPALRAFQAERPEVRVRLHDLSTEEMLGGLRDRTLQLAMLVEPARPLLRGLEFRAILRDPVRLAVAHGHPLARMRAVPLARIAAEPLVVLSQKSFPEYHGMLESILVPTKVAPRIAEEHESGSGMIAAVEAGYGVALATQSLTCTAGVRVKLLRIAPEPEPLAIGIAWLKGNLSAAAEHFVRTATKAAKQAV